MGDTHVSNFVVSVFLLTYVGIARRVCLFATMTKKVETDRTSSADAVRGFVLCGGQGTRLRSVVADRPKSMALISEAPFLQLLLDQLSLSKSVT
jgi:hypothetical protein